MIRAEASEWGQAGYGHGAARSCRWQEEVMEGFRGRAGTGCEAIISVGKWLDPWYL